MKSTILLPVPHYKKWCLMLLVIFALAAFPSLEALLCISECSSCPVICSPPPPSPENSKLPCPPPSHPSPPKSPKPPLHYYSPPQPPPAPPSFVLPPLPLPSPFPPAPPPYYALWENSPPPPPPPAAYYGGGGGANLPGINQAPPGTGQQRNYSYPYYYYYASPSKAPSCSINFQGSSVFVLTLCIHLIL